LEELKGLLALKMCEGIGDITAFKLISACGSAEAVFKEKSQHLSNISGISPNIEDLLKSGVDWGCVEKELNFINNNQIKYTSILDINYPNSLRLIDAPPIILFYRGEITSLSQLPCISIVGSRTPTSYGLSAVTEIVKTLKNMDINIISGLAHGIDVSAHKECLKHDVPTFGIVAHGLKTIYPALHRNFADEMVLHGGGVITEFLSDEGPNRENFPKRNRIIAGLSFATLVIEASKKSGTLITAELALHYKRKVFVLPGRYNDKLSEGCNDLLYRTKAKPILSLHGLISDLGFRQKNNNININQELTSSEKDLIKIIIKNNKIGLDNLVLKAHLNIGDCSSLLLQLEMKGLIRSLPGKYYEAC